jgi:hypothetical protein
MALRPRLNRKDKGIQLGKEVRGRESVVRGRKSEVRGQRTGKDRGQGSASSPEGRRESGKHVRDMAMID